MSDAALANLFSDIDAFLCRARRVDAARFADDGRTFSVWGGLVLWTGISALGTVPAVRAARNVLAQY